MKLEEIQEEEGGVVAKERVIALGETGIGNSEDMGYAPPRQDGKIIYWDN